MPTLADAPHRFRSVLNDRQPIVVRQGHYIVDSHRVTKRVHRYHCSDLSPSRPVHTDATADFCHCTQVVPKSDWIQTKCHLIAVDKMGHRTQIGDSISRRYERQCGNQYLVLWANAGQPQGNVKSCRATADCNDVGRSGKGR